jgi:shikimate kinase
LLSHQTNDEILETLDSLFLRRKKFYEKASMTINTEKKTIEGITHEIEAALSL